MSEPLVSASSSRVRAFALRRRLLAWYRRHRRAMPWRGERDPYRVWVSEVMLQQTQVATAQPYYLRFLERFPTLASLARARGRDVLAQWAGLGYYRRARHLHQAARLVVREHGGRVPDDPRAFGRLPGVGRYTTGAVLSICFDRSLPVLDGNVARVLSRLYAVRASVRDPAGARRLWALAAALVPRRSPGDWNQALMELGATVCLPRAPRCGECPVRALCRAYATGRVERFPLVAGRRPTERVRRVVALIEHRGRVLMTRRDGRLLEGLWELPGVEIDDGARAGDAAIGRVLATRRTVATRRALGAALRRLGIRARLTPTGRTVRHTITHRTIEVEVWRAVPAGRLKPRAAVAALPAKPRASLRYVDPERPAVPLTALARKITRDFGA